MKMSDDAAAELSQKFSDNSEMAADDYSVVPDPIADKVDLSLLRGSAHMKEAIESTKQRKGDTDLNTSDADLENLAELVPDIKSRRKSTDFEGVGDDEPDDEMSARLMLVTKTRTGAAGDVKAAAAKIKDSMDIANTDDRIPAVQTNVSKLRAHDSSSDGVDQSGHDFTHASLDDYPDSDTNPMDNDNEGIEVTQETKVPREFLNMSSGQSISTATQTHEVRMPMYLPTFKPATGCTNASDFIVRCFVARLRCGITVVKHGRSRWCKSRLRVLHVHPDGRSLSWKPAEGEPASSRRPPKLDLSTCQEVRHAWSPDPQNTMYTGTPILRQKCEAANAHKSFALIFKTRTVDITAVTADQCKVLMEGFSALCFRLQVANLAGRQKGKGQARPMPDEDGVSTTVSATLTNTSMPKPR
jgi:hypothetical protein